MVNLTLKQITKVAVPILKKSKVKKAGVFGSYARGDYKKKSDVDIIIQAPRGLGLEFVGIKLELEEKLKKKVDLLTYKSIHPLLKEQILSDEVRII